MPDYCVDYPLEDFSDGQPGFDGVPKALWERLAECVNCQSQLFMRFVPEPGLTVPVPYRKSQPSCPPDCERARVAPQSEIYCL